MVALSLGRCTVTSLANRTDVIGLWGIPTLRGQRLILVGE
jgi:hypothetical protein